MATEFDILAGQALSAYDLPGASFDFIQYSENITYRVQAKPRKTYLLRLHTPLTAEMGEHGAAPAMIESELAWLDGLKRAGLPVPAGVRNRAGERVTRLKWERTPLNASLLTWLDGEDYTRAHESEKTVRQAGSLIGRLHRHASRWRLPKGFTRPERGMPTFEQTLESLRPAIDDGRITYSDFRQFESALETLDFHLQGLRKTRQTWGLLHGDLHKGNFIYHKGKLALIDFSLSAFGPYLFDLAIALSDTREDLRPLLLKTYQEHMALPKNWQVLLEGLYLASMIGTFSFWINIPEAQENLVRRVPLIAQEYAAKFNYEERFWFVGE
jgi:Ser/Thr protein kinase RdoA (MazF antagonist)